MCRQLALNGKKGSLQLFSSCSVYYSRAGSSRALILYFFLWMCLVLGGRPNVARRGVFVFCTSVRLLPRLEAQRAENGKDGKDGCNERESRRLVVSTGEQQERSEFFMGQILPT